MRYLTQKMFAVLCGLSLVFLVSIEVPSTVGSAQAATPWYSFVHPTSNTKPTYFYDLDRKALQMRDYTGWSCTNCKSVEGHTYDQHMGSDYP